MTNDSQQTSGAAVSSSELVIPLRDLINSVNAFMESCDEIGVKIPFVPCEILMWQLKTNVKSGKGSE